MRNVYTPIKPLPFDKDTVKAAYTMCNGDINNGKNRMFRGLSI